MKAQNIFLILVGAILFILVCCGIVFVTEYIARPEPEKKTVTRCIRSKRFDDVLSRGGYATVFTYTDGSRDTLITTAPLPLEPGDSLTEEIPTR